MSDFNKPQKRSPRTQKRSPRTQKRSSRTQERSSRTQKRAPGTVLSKSHRDHPEYQSSQAAQRRSREEGGASPGTRSASSFSEGASGFGGFEESEVFQDTSINRSNFNYGDPFYIFDREIPIEEITDHGVHDDTNDILGSAHSAFAAVICVNGKPHFASIQGEIGDEVPTD